MIFLVHDIDGWRSSSKSDEWKRILNHAEALIVHNQKMLERLRMEGVMHPYMVNLELFDYLTDAQISVKSFQKSVVFAGNLGKSQFLQSWMECVRNYDIDLYGVGLKSRSSLPGRVRYHGGYAPEVLPCAIDGGFGLVWDGGSIDTCSGVMGGYMRWNNPHKLSLYIATGIPVIVWKESAVADLVAKYDIGYCISSLDEINHIMDRIDDQRYAELQDHLRPIQKKVLHGEFFKAAMNQVIQQIGI